MSYFIEHGWAKQGGVEEKIETLFLPDAKKIVGNTRREKLTIVEGPCGIGKSRTLIPLLESKFSSLDIPYLYRDAQRPFYNLDVLKNRYVEEMAEHNRGVAIIDEAGAIALYHQEKIAEVLRMTIDAGWSLLAVNAWFIDNQEARNKMVRRWQEAGEKVLRKKSKVISLGKKLLTRELARELLVKKFRSNPPPKGIPGEEVIEYILDVIPYNLGLLNMITNGSITTIEDARSEIRIIAPNQAGRIESKTIQKIKDRVIRDEWNQLQEIKRRKSNGS